MSRRVRWLVAILVAGLIAAVGLYLAAGVVVYDTMASVAPHCRGRFADNTPASWSAREVAQDWQVPGFDPTPYLVPEYRELSIPSRDPGITLSAWWLPVESGTAEPVVVDVHGLDSCKKDPTVLAPAGMLHRLGYNVLLIDLRDQGDSTIEDGRYAGGTEEYRDVMSAVDWLVAQGFESGRIGAIGFSLGAATVLIAAGQDPRIAAVWEDSGYADLERRVREELHWRGQPEILAPLGPLMARLLAGDDISSHTPLGEMTNLRGRWLFITHGTADNRTYVRHAADLAGEAWTQGVLTDLWIVPHAQHVQAMFLLPEEYELRLGTFFGNALGDPPEAIR